MILNCLITGVGGQGISAMSRIIRTAAFSRGLEVRGFDTIGMARLGGSWVSHVRMGQSIHSPLIARGKADVVIALEIAEAVRVYPFLSPTGRMLVLDRYIIPAPGKPEKIKDDYGQMLAFLKSCQSHPSEERLAQKGGGDWLNVINSAELIKKCGSSGVLGIALLGAAVKLNFFPITAEDISGLLRENIASVNPERFAGTLKEKAQDRFPPADLCIRAFNAGLELSGNLLRGI